MPRARGWRLLGRQGGFGRVRDLFVSVGNGFAFAVAIAADGLAHRGSVVGNGTQSTTPVETSCAMPTDPAKGRTAAPLLAHLANYMFSGRLGMGKMPSSPIGGHSILYSISSPESFNIR
jgi:hypothetical protein